MKLGSKNSTKESDSDSSVRTVRVRRKNPADRAANRVRRTSGPDEKAKARIAAKDPVKAAERARRLEKRRGLPEPILTSELAYEMARLLMSGVPAERSLAYLDADYFDQCVNDGDKERKKLTTWLRRWTNSPVLLAETTRLNGGEWQALESDRRLQIALDKHLAELAYLLYSRNYTDDDAPVAKMNAARESLMTHLEAGDGGSNAPWMQFVKDAMAGKLEEMGFVVPPVVPVPEKVKES